jgi:hypothetical protein
MGEDGGGRHCSVVEAVRAVGIIIAAEVAGRGWIVGCRRGVQWEYVSTAADGGVGCELLPLGEGEVLVWRRGSVGG